MFDLEKYQFKEAAVTTAIAGAGLAMGAYQTFKGNQQKKKAERALNSYERQDLDNAFKEIEISTLGADLLREENAVTSANLVDAARQGGSRSIIGAIPKVIGASNQINQQAAKLLDAQQTNREYAIANDNSRIEGITENRDVANLAGISSQVQAGEQNMWSGINGMASAAAYGARNMQGAASRPTDLEAVNPTMINDLVRPAAQMPFGSTPYSNPVARSYFDSGSDIFNGAYDNGDLINKYPNTYPRF